MRIRLWSGTRRALPRLLVAALASAALLAVAVPAASAVNLKRNGIIFVHGIEGRPPEMDAEDWIFFIGLPYLSYLLLIVAAVGIWQHAQYGALTLAFATMLLLVTGIHNAWDLVIWLAQQKRAPKNK